MVKAIYADENGLFSFFNLPYQRYFIKVSALGYDPAYKKLALTEKHSHINLHNIQLGINVSLLDEIVVEYERDPITIKNDTTEFIISQIPTKKSNAVEDVLKNIPGISSDGEGGLKSEGESIVQILVDGEEYFGDNIQMALKNIPADVVDKIQIIENSEEEEGKKINIKLKKSKKNIPFGNIQAGIGTKDRYQGKAVINKFGKKWKWTAITDINNINRQNIQFKKGKELFEDPLEAPINPKSGLTERNGVGLNLNYRLKKERVFNTSYIYNWSDKDLFRDIERTYITDALPYDMFQNGSQGYKERSHNLNSSYRHVFSNLSHIKTQFNFLHSKQANAYPYFRNTFSDVSIIRNSSDYDDSYKGNNLKTNFALDFTKALSKTSKRSLTLGGNIFYNKNRRDRILIIDRTRFDAIGDTSGIDTTLRNQDQSGEDLGWYTKIGYFEPVGKKNKLGIDYRFQNVVSSSERKQYNFDPLKTLDTSSSNSFEKNYYFHKPGLRFNRFTNRLKLTVSLSSQFSTLKGTNTLLDASTERHFINPSSFSKIIIFADSAKTHKFSLLVRSYVVEPKINQLQPVTFFYSNTRLFEGNPQLDPQQHYKANFSYLKLNKNTLSSFSVSINTEIINLKIINRYSLDTNLVLTIKPENAGFQYSYGGFAQWKWNLKEKGFTIISEANVSRSIEPFSFRTLEGNLKRNKEYVRVSVNNNIKNTSLKYSFNASLNHEKIAYPSISSLEGGIKNVDFLFMNYSTNISYDFLTNWTVGHIFSVNTYHATILDDRQEIYSWNAYIQKSIFNDKAVLQFYAYDLLNQNRGLLYRSRANFIEKEETTVLNRYFMINFLYYFSGNRK